MEKCQKLSVLRLVHTMVPKLFKMSKKVLFSRLFGHAIISCHTDLVADRFPILVSGNITATAQFYGATCAANMVETVSPLHHASPVDFPTKLFH
jgi:hypothetical protein